LALAWYLNRLLSAQIRGFILAKKRDGETAAELSTVLYDPDLIDSIFDVIATEFPELGERGAQLKQMARREFAGIETYITRRPKAERERVMKEVLQMFNGRNATEVASRLKISRASVYRIINRGR